MTAQPTVRGRHSTTGHKAAGETAPLAASARQKKPADEGGLEAMGIYSVPRESGTSCPISESLGRFNAKAARDKAKWRHHPETVGPTIRPAGCPPTQSCGPPKPSTACLPLSG